MPKKKKEEEPKESIVDLVKLLAKERDINEEEVFQAIESGLVAAYKREFGGNKQEKSDDYRTDKKEKSAESKQDKKKNDINVVAEIDRQTGEISLYRIIKVVEVVEDKFNEVSRVDVAEELGVDPEEIAIGEVFKANCEVDDLGRLAAKAAKDAINQKLRDAESAKIEAEFSGKIGEVTSGTIIKKDSRNVYVNIGRAEAVVKHDGQIRGNRNETYDQDRIMKFLVMGVEEANGRPSVILSRTDAKLVSKLFELEVPEIKSGDVIIKSVAREAGSRTKIAVFSKDPDIDAKGSCVGQRGQRVQQIMNELAEEKIDIVDWKEDPALFISEALQPAKVSRVDIEITRSENGEIEKKAKVIVPDQQFSLAIGKNGQNVRLAARLTGFKIDIKKENDERQEASKAIIDDFKVVDDEADKEG